MGLLSKTLSLANESSNNITKANKISFSRFTEKYNISFCAVFSKINNNYVITDSLGFDGISIISSISSVDFWNGTLKDKNSWLSLTTSSEMVPFYQLFSFNQKDKINSIYIHGFEDKIFMVCSSDKSSFIPNDVIAKDLINLSFDKEPETETISFDLSKNESVFKYEIDFKNAIDFHIQKNLRKLEYKTIISDVIHKEINLFMKRSFTVPSLVHNKNHGTFNLAIISENEIPENLLKTHLIKELENILDEESKLVSINNLGKSNSYKDVMDFLQAE